MNTQQFNQVLEQRISAIKSTLASKNDEYASDTDRLHNFKVAALLYQKPKTPEVALWGMLAKHLVSVIDIVAATKRGEFPSDAIRSEKIGDSINYLILLEALLIERRDISDRKRINKDIFGDIDGAKFNRRHDDIR